MRGVVWFLLILSSAVLLVSCFPTGTPMHSNCRYLPSIEECQAAADQYITDDCLRKCIRRLCEVGKPKCGKDEDLPLHCATRKAEGDEVGGYVPEPLTYEERSCTQPREEVTWCEYPYTPPCQQQNIVHEYAHACGWRHKQGKGVPGNNGRVDCK